MYLYERVHMCLCMYVSARNHVRVGLCVCMHVCMYAYTCACMRDTACVFLEYVSMRMFTYTHVWVLCICAYFCTNMCAHVYSYACVLVFVCIGACLLCVCMHTWIYWEVERVVMFKCR